MFLEVGNQFALCKQSAINYEETCISRVSDTIYQILYLSRYRFLIREARLFSNLMRQEIWQVKSHLTSQSPVSFFGFFKIYFWLRWVFIAARGLSLVAVSRGYSLLRCAGFSLEWLLLLRSTGSRRTGFSSCGSRALERGISSCGAWAQ